MRGRPGPKPKRLFLRIARSSDGFRLEPPPRRALQPLLAELERVGRLVAHGELVDPPGDLLVLRAAERAEVERILRNDPWRQVEEVRFEIWAWNPTDFGVGVNLEPPPALGSGRLTLLQRVAVFVRDQRRAVEWYRDVLGLTVRFEDPPTHYVELSLARGTAAISLVAPRKEWGEPFYSEATARIGTPTGIAFQTDSVAALELRLLHAGARVTGPARTEPWGGVSLRFADPDGNEFLAFEVPRPPTHTSAAAPPMRTGEEPEVAPASKSPRRKRL